MTNTHMGDAVTSVGKYTAADGTEKNRFLKVGAWFQSDQGEVSIKLEAVPLVLDPKGGCWLKLFHKQDKQAAPPPARTSQPPANQQRRPPVAPPATDYQDEVPF